MHDVAAGQNGIRIALRAAQQRGPVFGRVACGGVAVDLEAGDLFGRRRRPVFIADGLQSCDRGVQPIRLLGLVTKRDQR